LTLAAVVLLVVGLSLFLRHSRWGKAMRAMSDNPDLARLSGVDNRKVTMVATLANVGGCAGVRWGVLWLAVVGGGHPKSLPARPIAGSLW